MKLAKSQVLAISCGKNTRGLFQTGKGIRENAYGPAKGGLVAGRYTTGGPMSGFITGSPGDGIGLFVTRFSAFRLRPDAGRAEEQKQKEKLCF